MTADGAWDADAQGLAWLGSDEQIVWRGRPDHQIRLNARTIGTGVGSAALLAYGLFFLFLTRGAPTFFRVFVVVIMLAWAWQLIITPIRRRIRADKTLYALTNSRAVSIISGTVVGSASTLSPVVVRRPRGGHLASAMFEPPSSNGSPHGAAVFDAELPTSGISWSRSSRGEETVLVFKDFAHVDGFTAAARHAGFMVTETPAPSLRMLARASMGLYTTRSPRTTPRPAGIREWVRRRVLRHEVRIASPLPPEVVLERLGQLLTPRRNFQNFGISGPTGNARYTGRVTQSRVEASYVSAGRNSWNWVFKGAVVAEPKGSALIGTIGPVDFVAVFSIVWVGGVMLFLLAGVLGTLGDLVKGHAPTALPLLLLPIAFLAFFAVLTEFASHAAENGWSHMEERLRAALESPR